MTFAATHTVGGGGAATWAVPDPTAPDGPRLDPWLAVQVIEYRGDWAHIRCENGWEAWMDGRSLMAGPTPPAGPASGYLAPGAAADPASGYAQPGTLEAAQPASGYVPPTAQQPVVPQQAVPQQQPVPQPPAQAYAAPVAAPAAYGGPPAAGPVARPSAARPGGPLPAALRQRIQIAGAGGAVLAVISAYIGWFEVPGSSGSGFTIESQSLQGWDLKLMQFISGDFTGKPSGPWIGLVVMFAAAGLLVFVDQVPGWVIMIAGLCAVVPALFFILRFLTDDIFDSVDWGFGSWLALAGGAGVVYAGYLLLKAQQPARR